jgi:hypothetical protein
MAYTTIKKPSDYFNTKLYTGNSTGSTEQSITGLGFSPDMVWLKSRTDAEKHSIADTVRGATKTIHPHLTDAEETSAGHMVSFDSDGYTVGVDNYSWNKSGSNYASWCWRGSDSSAVSNTDGSITSTVSANTTSGFSIVSWTGTGSNGSVGHGLGGVDFMIIKDRDNTRNWYTWNKTFAYNDRIKLDTTDAKETGTDNMTALPDSTKINMATSTQNNGSGNNYVGYFFQEKQGFSKFGSYVGNGNADGTFVYTGFKPAFVICKKYGAGGLDGWKMIDNKRNSYNVVNANLSANASDAEATNQVACDFLSNGFKWRSANGGENASTQQYIYMAFAEEPLVGDNPATAR